MQITLKAILEALSYETLSFMAESNHSNGSLSADQIPKVVGRINSVLRRMAVKFVLRERRIKVNVTLDRRYYTLNADDTWIQEDPDEAFTGDVGRILAIETPTGRNHDLGDKATLRTIVLRDEGKSFALDDTLEAGVYVVIYKAATPQFVSDPSNLNLDQILHIPEALLNALYLGVAAITYESIGGAENVSMAQAKWSQYEKECAEARINSAVEIEENDEGNKFLDRGFH